MRLTKLSPLALILPLLLLASACGHSRPASVSAFPPSADLKSVTEPKPVPGVDTVTNPEARARHDVAVEAWGEGIWRAGGRICRWVLENGGTLPFRCPTPDQAPTEPRPR